MSSELSSDIVRRESSRNPYVDCARESKSRESISWKLSNAIINDPTTNLDLAKKQNVRMPI